MAKSKHVARKVRFGRRTKGNRMVPAWVMQKTNKGFKRNPKQRVWRRGRLKV